MKPIFLGFILFYLHNMLYITEIFCNFAISETFFFNKDTKYTTFL